MRLYGPAPLPAAVLAALLARAATRAGAIPEAQPWGAVGLRFDPVPLLLRKAVPLRGFRLPEMGNAGLARVVPGPSAFHLHFAEGARPELALDEDLLTAVEGSRAFEEGEALLARGELADAEAFYLRRGEAPDRAPFAQSACSRCWRRAPTPGTSRSTSPAACGAPAPGPRPPGGPRPPSAWRAARAARPGSCSRSSARSPAGAARRPPPSTRSPRPGAPSPPKRRRAPAARFRTRSSSVPTTSSAWCRSRRSPTAPAITRARCAPTGASPRSPASPPRPPAPTCGWASCCCGSKEDRPAARLHFDAALRLCADDAEALTGLATLCHRDGEHLRALRLLEQLRESAGARGDAALEAQACLLAGEIGTRA